MAYLEQAQSRSAPGVVATTEPGRSLTFPAAEQWIPLLILSGAVAGWELSVHLGWISALFFPAPSVIAQTLLAQLMGGDLLTALGATLLRLSMGLLLGGGAGLLLGLIMGWSTRVRRALDPLVAALHPIPKIALLPLALVLFGIGETPKIVLIAVSTFFPMLINTVAGVQQIAPIHLDVARNYGATPLKLFRRVIVPGSLPLILTGVRIALNTALLVTIAVELLMAQEGLGSIIWMAWQTLRVEEMYATLIVIACLGMMGNGALAYGARYAMPWNHRRGDPVNGRKY